MPTTPPSQQRVRRRSADADPRSGATRRRLLEVALDVFCERGFRTATVRGICAKAGANVAAVSYHFGDKVGLYRAVIGEARCQADQTQSLGHLETANPEQRLEVFVHAFVERLLKSDGCATHGKLMAWEMIEPTGVLDDVVRDTIRPTWELLREIVAANLDIDPRETRHEALLRRTTASVLSQVLIYRNCREVVERLHPAVLGDPQEAERIAGHIVEFSLAALRGMRARMEKGNKQGTPSLGGHPRRSANASDPSRAPKRRAPK